MKELRYWNNKPFLHDGERQLGGISSNDDRSFAVIIITSGYRLRKEITQRILLIFVMYHTGL
jgi:hypothetical protein